MRPSWPCIHVEVGGAGEEEQLALSIVKQCFFIISTHCLVMSSLSNQYCQIGEDVVNKKYLF